MNSEGTSQNIFALEVMYTSTSSNEESLKSQRFLDSVKFQVQSFYWGYQVGLNNLTNFIVKHFGLGLQVDSIKTQWNKYDS